MGNSLGVRMKMKSTAKVMKITGETFKLKTPVRAGSVLLNHPGHVLLDSEAVKHYGLRAKPLDPLHDLRPSRLYFLVDLPQLPAAADDKPRRVRSTIQMTAKDRLESLLLARRSASDLSILNPPPPPKTAAEEQKKGGVRVRIRLPKAELERLMAESRDGAEAAEKIVGLYMANGNGIHSAAAGGGGDIIKLPQGAAIKKKRVGFLPLPINEGEGETEFGDHIPLALN
ncbi:uncharacterized protein At1g66480-like [Andrographis paniculata]|uniref:uncharacterized protein At1g66480-like n=1 Tax=Andrographis paniculata TaxID=175694 RepID=UPI0021E7D69A|nr:uncharacterized protein At1g66480-like [Andrographis paniculata]